MKNNSKINVNKLTTMGVLSAVSVVLMLILRLPYPGAPFLEYDPADIAILIGTLVYGPVEGVILTFIVSAIQAITVSSSSQIHGFIMHMVATGLMAVVVGLIYHKTGKKHTTEGLVVGLAAGSIVMIISMIPLNLLVTPYFLGVPVEAVKTLMIPAIIPFNLIKAAVNSVATFLLAKSLMRTKFFKESLDK